MIKKDILKIMNILDSKYKTTSSNLSRLNIVPKGSNIANRNDLIIYSFSMLLSPSNYRANLEFNKHLKKHYSIYLEAFIGLLEDKYEIGIFSDDLICLIGSKTKIYKLSEPTKSKGKVIRQIDLDTLRSILD